MSGNPANSLVNTLLQYFCTGNNNYSINNTHILTTHLVANHPHPMAMKNTSGFPLAQ